MGVCSCTSVVEEQSVVPVKDVKWSAKYIPHVPDEEQEDVIAAIHAYELYFTRKAADLRKDFPSKDWIGPFNWQMTEVNTVLKIPAAVIHVHFNVTVSTNFTYTPKGEVAHNGHNSVCMMSKKDSNVGSNTERSWKVPDEVDLCKQRMKELKMRAKEKGEETIDVKVKAFKKPEEAKSKGRSPTSRKKLSSDQRSHSAGNIQTVSFTANVKLDLARGGGEGGQDTHVESHLGSAVAHRYHSESHFPDGAAISSAPVETELVSLGQRNTGETKSENVVAESKMQEEDKKVKDKDEVKEQEVVKYSANN